MLRRSFFKKMAMAAGVTFTAPFVITSNKTSSEEQAENADHVLIIAPKSVANGGLNKHQRTIINQLNRDFRLSGKLKQVRNVTETKATDKAYKAFYIFDSKESKELYVKQKAELLAALSPEQPKKMS